MNLILKRKWLDDISTIGELWAYDKFFCYTLEDKVRMAKIPGKTAIPFDSYPVTITFSPKFNKPMPLINCVPNFEGVRIHPGNTDADTEGCILVGDDRDADFIGQSRAAFNRLYVAIGTAIKCGEGVMLSIIMAPDAVDKRTTTT